MKQIHRQRLLALARQVESKKPLRRKLGRRDINITAARAKITGKQAARVVRHYVKTGNVDWSVRGEP